MKLHALLFALPFVAATQYATSSYPTAPYSNATTSEECCCLTYKPACTMNLERMYHVKLFYNRKEGITPEEFNSYWANHHSTLTAGFHIRVGVVRSVQYHSTPEIRDLVRFHGGPPVLEYDAVAELWMYSLETLQALQSDPYYVNTIQPDEQKFIDETSVKIVVGVDYIVVEGQKKVEQHGRVF
ncbi:hypothetical protein K491DRAFT_609590 [Lophiostoma macrostomum CBS 122681]|uniref:EthD domain-containing protein n=1 Tax=Lophiostoma macrostomum CBS 122681 TaxID=1314788 RepID=A0A6A6SQS7_9PLEO|nr:hypothetical protein K491DRAFT_609590 [Lophiostoma macrostomum CBS 122681]